MKTFSEIRNLFLTDHHEKYCAFTRLLIALSVAFITLLASSSANITMSSWFLKGSLILQLTSLCFGLFVQHQIMLGPLKRMNQLQKILGQTSPNEDVEAKIAFLENPSRLEQQRWLGFLEQVAGC